MQAQISTMRGLAVSCAALLFALGLVPGSVSVHAADAWTTRTSGTTNDLRSVAVVDNTTAWVVGSRGTILKTADGGTNWTAQPVGTRDDLTGVAAVGAQTLWIVGANGTILKTTNGGTDWSRQAINPDAYLASVAAVDANTAWAVEGESGTIFNTTDGGDNWTAQYEYGYPLSAVAATDANTAWAVGQAGAVLFTTDGGQTWKPWWCTDCHYLSGITAVDGTTLWTVGRSGGIGRSLDGGLTWEMQNGGIQDDLIAVTASSADTAWVVGTNGKILKTTDGGIGWTVQSIGGSTLRAVAASSPGTVYAVGDRGTILQAGVAEVYPTPAATAVTPSEWQAVGKPGKWNGTVTVVQKFNWQGSATWSIEKYAGEATAQLTTRVNFTDSVASADTSVSGSTHYTTNGTGSPCNYEITRTEAGQASFSGPLEASLSQPTADQLALNISVLTDPAGNIDVQEVTRNYGAESCWTETDRRQYAFGSNNTSLEGFYRELQFELEHGTLLARFGLTSTGPGGAPLYTATETTAREVPVSRPVGMPNIIAPGQETMTVTWSLQASPAD